MTATSHSSARASGNSRIRPAYIPPQHGAWAFLGLPLALGVLVAPIDALLVVLAVAWITAYPLSYAVLGLVRGKRRDRFRRPLLVWSAVFVPAAIVLVVARPWLVWVALGYLVLFAVHVRYARRNDERSLVNDIVFIAECSVVVVVMWAVGAGQRSWAPPRLDEVPGHAWILMIVCAMVLAGSTLHVKSLIRQRADRRFARASWTTATISVGAALGLATWWGLPSGLWLVLPFLLLLARAVLVARRPLRPGIIGMIELACVVATIVCCALASR